MSRFLPPLLRPSRGDQETPIYLQKPSRPLFRRGSTSNREKLPLARTFSRENGPPGAFKDPDVGKRSRGRSGSAPPDNRTHYHSQQDGQTRLSPVSANGSRAYAENLVNTSWFPGHSQTVELQMSSRMAMIVHSGQLGDDHRGRARRSSDARHPTHVQSAPAPRPAYSTPSSPSDLPVIPGFSPSEGMGFRNLLRKNSRSRPKIFFYHKHEPYYGFTNFSPHPVTYGGKGYPTSEHLFQALKVSGELPFRARILLIPRPFRLFSSFINQT